VLQRGPERLLARGRVTTPGPSPALQSAGNDLFTEVLGKGILGSCPYNSRVSRRSQWKPEVSLGEALGDEPTIRRCEEMLCSRVLEAEREKARQAERERAGK